MHHNIAKIFPTKSRHGTIYYFRRRIPAFAQTSFRKQMFVVSLQTADRQLAIVRGRAAAAYIDKVFQSLLMAKSPTTDGLRLDYKFEVVLDELGLPGRISVEASPDEQDAVNAAIKKALVVARQLGVPNGHG